MSKDMTPSQTDESKEMTDGQIEKIMGNVRAALCKNKDRFRSADVQGGALEHGRLDAKLVAAVEKAVEQAVVEANNVIVRTVRNIQRGRTRREALDATGRKQSVDDGVLATMPWGEGPEEVELVYVRAGKWLSPAEQEKFLAERGLVPDPQAQMADNEADPEFADEHPNGVQWDHDGTSASFAIFIRSDDERGVDVNRLGNVWLDDWWFAGVRK